MSFEKVIKLANRLETKLLKQAEGPSVYEEGSADARVLDAFFSNNSGNPESLRRAVDDFLGKVTITTVVKKAPNGVDTYDAFVAKVVKGGSFAKAVADCYNKLSEDEKPDNIECAVVLAADPSSAKVIDVVMNCNFKCDSGLLLAAYNSAYKSAVGFDVSKKQADLKRSGLIKEAHSVNAHVFRNI